MITIPPCIGDDADDADDDEEEEEEEDWRRRRRVVTSAGAVPYTLQRIMSVTVRQV